MQPAWFLAGQVLNKLISIHTLERLLMLLLLVITFDTLLIKLMQTAQLTFNGGTVTEFFAVLFRVSFPWNSDVVKRSATHRIIRDP